MDVADAVSSEGQDTMNMTMLGHIRELRTRLTIVALIFVVGACAAYAYHDQILSALLEPLHGQRLIYLNPAGGFSFILLVSVYCGIALASPIAIQQLYGFVKPLLPKITQRYSARVLFVSLTLLVSGILFGYYLAIPGALNFLQNFGDQYIDAALTADSYLNFIIAYTIGLGIVFQLPLFLILIHWIKPLTPKGLLKSERWTILLAFIAAALITPTPDPLNQVIIALPIIVIYQLGVIAVLMSIRQKKKHMQKITLAANKQKEAVRKYVAKPSQNSVARTIPNQNTKYAPLAEHRMSTKTPVQRNIVRSTDGIVRKQKI